METIYTGPLSPSAHHPFENFTEETAGSDRKVPTNFVYVYGVVAG